MAQPDLEQVGRTFRGRPPNLRQNPPFSSSIVRASSASAVARMSGPLKTRRPHMAASDVRYAAIKPLPDW
jgi:hypothetical protein